MGEAVCQGDFVPTTASKPHISFPSIATTRSGSSLAQQHQLV